MTLPKILSLTADHSASAWFRIRQFFQEFERQKLMSTYIISGGEDMGDLDRVIKQADIITCQYTVNPDAFMYAKELNPKAKFIIDFDDNCFRVPPSSTAYKYWGTEDVTVDTPKGKKDLWVSGKSQGFNKFKNRKVVGDLKMLMKEADVVTCASPRLVDYLGEFTGKTAFVANTIDPTLVTKDELTRDSKEFRIMWHGTSIHQMELWGVLDPLEDFLRANKDAHYYQMGSKVDKKFKGRFKKRVHELPWVQYQAVLPMIQMQAFDTSIIPLRENEFNYYKAESKWLEMAAAGLPAIVQAPSPYADSIVHGETGILFSDGENMKQQLDWVYENRDEAKEIGRNAKEYVLKNRNSQKWARQLVKFYKEL